MSDRLSTDFVLADQDQINSFTGKPVAHNNKGGSVASNGYKLTYVGKGHHLADVRGYAYEHRVVAEEKIGRRLKKGEQVHHKDGNIQNNHPDNLEVMANIAEHRARHRKGKSAVRLPGEDNPVIECACGCGQKFTKYDRVNRVRRFISGHNNRLAKQ